MHRIGTRMYVSRRDVFRKGAKPFRNCFPSPPSLSLPPQGKPGNLLILDTSHWFTSVTRLVQTILPLPLSLSTQLFPSIFPLSLRISHALFPFFQPIYPFLLRNYCRKREKRKREKYIRSKLHDSVFGKRVEKIELVIFVWIFWDPEAVENYYCARWWVV